MEERSTEERSQAEPASRGEDTKPLTERAKGIIVNPKQEWQRIDAEPASIGGIYASYVMILAAIGPIALVLGTLVFGYPSMFGITYHPSAGAVIGGAVLNYVLTLIGVYVLALIIQALAPTFDGVKDRLKAFKVAAYSATAAWLAGIFNLIPALSFLGILGLYSLYLLYLGLPRLMRAPESKALGYTVVTILAAIVIWFVVGIIGAAVMNPLTGAFAGGAGRSTPESASGSIEIPGGGTIDLGQLEAASRQFEAAAEQSEAGSAPMALPPEELQKTLPASLGAYRRVEIASSGANSGGLGGSQAEARYARGNNNIELEVIDLGGAASLAAMGSAFDLQSNRQTETGYEKSTTVNGRMVNEEWNSATNRGSYGVLVSNRFMVQAEGNVDGIDSLKQAVNAIDTARLEALAE